MIATTDAKSLMMQQTAATKTTTTAAKHDWIQPEAVAADIFFSVRFFFNYSSSNNFKVIGCKSPLF